jgi:hypothetical protein
MPSPFSATGLFRNPADARSQDSEWRVVMSYAWAIFRHATEKKKGRRAAEAWDKLKDKAHEWGNDFVQSFNPPYINIVLPACDHIVGELQTRLVGHLTELWRTVEQTVDAQQLEHYLASLHKS